MGDLDVFLNPPCVALGRRSVVNASDCILSASGVNSRKVLSCINSQEVSSNQSLDRTLPLHALQQTSRCRLAGFINTPPKHHVSQIQKSKSRFLASRIRGKILRNPNAARIMAPPGAHRGRIRTSLGPRSPIDKYRSYSAHRTARSLLLYWF
jgi:hypothetical protein